MQPTSQPDPTDGPPEPEMILAPFDNTQRLRMAAEEAAREYAESPEALIARWQHHPPETFDYQEAVAAVVMQLNKEGVPAWNGDATCCVAHMLKAQFDRWAALRVVPPQGGRPCQEDHTPNAPTRDALDAAARGDVEPFEFPAGGQPPSDGIRPYEEKFAHLAALPVNWDSYGSPVASADAIQRARAWLEGASIVPLNDGGVQIEWHQEGVEFELAFNADGTNDVLFATENSGRKVVRAVPPTEEPTDLASAVRSYFAGGPMPENIAAASRGVPPTEGHPK